MPDELLFSRTFNTHCRANRGDRPTHTQSSTNFGCFSQYASWHQSLQTTWTCWPNCCQPSRHPARILQQPPSTFGGARLHTLTLSVLAPRILHHFKQIGSTSAILSIFPTTHSVHQSINLSPWLPSQLDNAVSNGLKFSPTPVLSPERRRDSSQSWNTSRTNLQFGQSGQKLETSLETSTISSPTAIAALSRGRSIAPGR